MNISFISKENFQKLSENDKSELLTAIYLFQTEGLDYSSDSVIVNYIFSEWKAIAIEEQNQKQNKSKIYSENAKKRWGKMQSNAIACNGINSIKHANNAIACNSMQLHENADVVEVSEVAIDGGDSYMSNDSSCIKKENIINIIQEKEKIIKKEKEVSEPVDDLGIFQKVEVAKEKPDFSDQFAKWYAIYPVKKGKALALKSFIKALKFITFDELVAKTELFVDYIESQGVEKNYTPHPSTWLNGKRWEDELKIDAPPKRSGFTTKRNEFINNMGKYAHERNKEALYGFGSENE